MKREWHFLINPFLNSTGTSFRKALRISLFHDSALFAAKADAAILALYNSYHPLHTTLQTAFNTWKQMNGTQQGSTLGMMQLLDQLSSVKIRSWDVSIQVVYPQDTAQYKALLPNRRSPFQKGPQLDRLGAVKTLSQAIGTTTTLAAVKTDVDTFYTALNTALNNQKTNIRATDTASDAVETARQAMCVAQYANLGAMIQKWASSPSQIGHYFDLKSIRDREQDTFTGHVKAGEYVFVLQHTFTSGEQVLLVNEGATRLEFFLASSKNGKPQPGVPPFLVEPGTEVEVNSIELGVSANTFLIVHNMVHDQEGAYTVELL